MKNCIVQAHKAGLFSLVNNVITCARIYDNLEVDWSQSLYGGGNLWLELFNPLPPLPQGEPYHVLRDYPDQWLTYKNPGRELYGKTLWRRLCNQAWRRFSVQSQIIAKRDVFIDEHRMLDFIAVMVRSNPHAGEQVSERSQSLDEYARAIEAELRPGTQVFVMAGDMESLVWLRARFPVVFDRDTRRVESRDTDLMQIPQTVEDARQCMKEVLVASWARTLIHPVSNMATAALYIEPELKGIYLP